MPECAMLQLYANYCGYASGSDGRDHGTPDATSTWADSVVPLDFARRSPLTNAPMKNNTAATCSSRAKLASVSVPAAISPTLATAVSADVLPTAFWTAAAIPLRDGSTDARFNAVSGVLVRTRPIASTVIPGSRCVTMLKPCADGRISSRPIPASSGPVVRKNRGPIRAALAPTRLASRNDMVGVGKVTKPATVAQ